MTLANPQRRPPNFFFDLRILGFSEDTFAARKIEFKKLKKKKERPETEDAERQNRKKNTGTSPRFYFQSLKAKRALTALTEPFFLSTLLEDEHNRL